MEAQAKSKRQAQQERFRMIFDESLGDQSEPIRHDKAAVLLLSWEKSMDDLNVKPEVDALQHVFEDLYGFTVHNKQFHNRDKTRSVLQARKYLSQFAHDEDGERRLLIVYYAGHGYKHEQQQGSNLKLAGDIPPGNSIKTHETERAHFVWAEAENNIRGLEADVLLIFDCCYAGQLRRWARDPDTGYFEFLGSCTENQKARTPGKHSFTSALIWALQKLAADKEAFDTVKLRRTILECPDFPQKEQFPVLSDRHDPSGHIVIDRRGLSKAATRPPPSRTEKERALEHQEFVDIRLHFHREIDDMAIDKVVDHLRPLRGDKTLQMARIEYPDQAPKLRVFVEKLIMRERAASAANKPNSQVLLAPQTPRVTPTELLPPEFESPLQTHSPLMTGHEMLTPLRTQSTAPTAVQSMESSISGGNECSPLLGRRASSVRLHADDESIAYHVKAIARRLHAMVYNALAWLTFKLYPHKRRVDRDF